MLQERQGCVHAARKPCDIKDVGIETMSERGSFHGSNVGSSFAGEDFYAMNKLASKVLYTLVDKPVKQVGDGKILIEMGAKRDLKKDQRTEI